MWFVERIYRWNTLKIVFYILYLWFIYSKFLLVVSALKVFVTSSDNVIEPEAGSASATPDLNQYATPDQNQYANAYQVYQHWAQQQQQHPIHHKPPPTLNPFKILKNRQDSFAGDIEAFFGPDAGVCYFHRLVQISDQIFRLNYVGYGLFSYNSKYSFQRHSLEHLVLLWEPSLYLGLVQMLSTSKVLAQIRTQYVQR